MSKPETSELLLIASLTELREKIARDKEAKAKLSGRIQVLEEQLTEYCGTSNLEEASTVLSKMVEEAEEAFRKIFLEASKMIKEYSAATKE